MECDMEKVRFMEKIFLFTMARGLKTKCTVKALIKWQLNNLEELVSFMKVIFEIINFMEKEVTQQNLNPI